MNIAGSNIVAHTVVTMELEWISKRTGILKYGLAKYAIVPGDFLVSTFSSVYPRLLACYEEKIN